ncbi:hypothetical protein BX600DRAFT_438624 [Xylariales sp. PMI_506]|nr:hypothetical protein BX600DRAFT_438624 [Xylariales sp. PMI_506]
MSSYLITGGSNSLGLEFIRQLSKKPENTVFAFVDDKEVAQRKVADLRRVNIHFFEAHEADFAATRRGVDYISSVTGGRLDYVIANGMYQNAWSTWDSLSYLRKKEDLELINNLGVFQAGPYSMSMAALNVVIAKFSAEFNEHGILFMGVSPGLVDSGDDMADETHEKALKLLRKFKAGYPSCKRPLTPEESVEAIISVVEKATVDGDAGSFVSHYGTKKWL